MSDIECYCSEVECFFTKFIHHIPMNDCVTSSAMLFFCFVSFTFYLFISQSFYLTLSPNFSRDVFFSSFTSFSFSSADGKKDIVELCAQLSLYFLYILLHIFSRMKKIKKKIKKKQRIFARWWKLRNKEFLEPSNLNILLNIFRWRLSLTHSFSEKCE